MHQLIRARVATALFLITFSGIVLSAENEITLYGWLSDISGEATLNQRNIPFAVDFDELIDKYEAGIQLHYERRGEKWGAGADITYLSLSDRVRGITTDTDSSILEGFAIYKFRENIDLIAGLRSMSFEVDLESPGGLTATTDLDIVDGFVGARAFFDINDKWFWHTRFDIGAGDSDVVINAIVGANWAINDSTTLRLAYRILDYELDNDGRRIDKGLELQYSGPAIGISFKF